jgi:Mn2+/Fe2+ NRAMP family transporter
MTTLEADQADASAKGPLRRFLNTLGPGLITGASDDDPSGIATYSQAGAQFGFGLGWTMIVTYPLMVFHPIDQRKDWENDGAWHCRQSAAV